MGLIEAKRQADAQKIVKTFPEDSEIQILNGRYGVYIACGKSNYKIPKTVTDPAALTLEECKTIISEQDAKPRKTTRRTTTRKK